MKLLLIFTIGLLSLHCSTDKRIIRFINQSNEKIDSITVIISSATIFSEKQLNVLPNDTITTYIPVNTPISNHHDISVSVTIWINRQPPIEQVNYNDLTGTLDRDFTFVFTKEKQIRQLNTETQKLYK